MVSLSKYVLVLGSPFRFMVPCQSVSLLYSNCQLCCSNAFMICPILEVLFLPDFLFPLRWTLSYFTHPSGIPLTSSILGLPRRGVQIRFPPLCSLACSFIFSQHTFHLISRGLTSPTAFVLNGPSPPQPQVCADHTVPLVLRHLRRSA